MIIEVEKSFFKHIFSFLTEEGKDVSIREEVDIYIYDLVDHLNAYEKKPTKKFLKNFLYPGIAVYKALKDTWMKEEEILDLLMKYLDKYAKGTLTSYGMRGVTGRSTGSYASTVYSELKKRDEGWEKVWLYNTKKESACNVTKCLVYDVCKGLECAELTKLFCGFEKKLMKNMNGEGLFSLNHAIGLGDEFCDFVFEGK